jgi:hypothetical protein
METRMTVLLLELNEINFEHVRAYVALGKLPVLGRLVDTHGLTETTSEQNYEELEPWIQWVTAHTGLSLAEHGVFRLGDIVDGNLRQIWEALEEQGLKVGAISPMNAKNRCRDAAFFLPDPWTRTDVTGSAILRRLHGAVAQSVNDNAQARLTPASAVNLLTALLAYAAPANYGAYLSLMAPALRHKWLKALVLDRLLADIFVRETRRKRPDFASLFLNAGAHIQHHYMFNAEVYAGPGTNPDWYLAKDVDPVRQVYELYDRIVGQVERAFPKARLMIATGLHQDPHSQVTYYWRLKDHAAFLRSADVPFQRVEPRMSRDFMIFCASPEEAAQAERRLESLRAMDGTPLFEIDNRGQDLFAMLTWSHDIGADFEYRIGNRTERGLRDAVSFVAIKNGDHNGVGYLIDTGLASGEAPARIALRSLPERIAAACGVPWQAAA